MPKLTVEGTAHGYGAAREVEQEPKPIPVDISDAEISAVAERNSQFAPDEIYDWVIRVRDAAMAQGRREERKLVAVDYVVEVTKAVIDATTKEQKRSEQAIAMARQCARCGQADDLNLCGRCFGQLHAEIISDHVYIVEHSSVSGEHCLHPDVTRRLVAAFVGEDAKARAQAYAKSKFSASPYQGYQVIEVPLGDLGGEERSS